MTSARISNSHGDRQIEQKSAEPPSWVTFLAGADWWIKVLAAYAAVYAAEIVKEAGKDTWKHRRKAVVAGITAGKGITKLASSIVKFRQKLLPSTPRRRHLYSKAMSD